MYDKKKLKTIKNAAEQWTQKTAGLVSKRPERRHRFETLSGMPVERALTPVEQTDADYLEDLGFPGEFPYTRGVQPTMYRGRFWTMRQYAGFASAEESNKRYKYLLEHGQTGLSVAFDLPTQIGYDSDHPLAQGEVGKVGVAIDSLADMEALFDGIPLDKVSTSMTINAPAAILLAMYIETAAKQGIPAAKLKGTIQNDILKEYAARGTYIFPPGPSMRIITDIFAFCSRNVPSWNTISISGYHIREAGSTAVQELAFTLGNGIAYVEAAINAGLAVDAFAPRLSFFFNAHMDFFEEIAKFRAARRLWARIMKDRFGAKNPKSLMLRFHTQTAGCTLTAQQPQNNVMRVTLQALSAVLGGTQSLHTNSMDEAFSLPREEAVQIALRTQQVIAYESGVADTVDPLGGSFFVEHLTNEMERQAQIYLDQIEKKGGAVASIEQGFIQKEIQESAYHYQRAIETGDQVVIGLNRFQQEEPPLANLLRVDPAVRGSQTERLAEVKRRRDAKKVTAALENLERSARGTDNLMPPILEAVRCYATLGEICHTLRTVFGEYKAVSTL